MACNAYLAGGRPFQGPTGLEDMQRETTGHPTQQRVAVYPLRVMKTVMERFRLERGWSSPTRG